MAVRLTLITRHDCHLCADMAAVIDAVARRFGARVDVRDVDANPELLALYTDEVPILLIDDRQGLHVPGVGARPGAPAACGGPRSVYLNR